MRTAILVAGCLLVFSSSAFAEDTHDQSGFASQMDERTEVVEFADTQAVGGLDERSAARSNADDNTDNALIVAYQQRALKRRGTRQIVAPTVVLPLSTPVIVVALPFLGLSNSNSCERNKSICRSYTVSDFSAIRDDSLKGLALSAIATEFVGAGLLYGIGARNRQLSRLDVSSAELRQARGQMLEQYGRRTQWAGAGMLIGGAITAGVSSIVYAANIGDCEVWDCKTVPEATRAVIASAFIGGITGSMMLGVGSATRKRGERAHSEDQTLTLSFAPWFDHRGGSGATMAMTW